MLLSELTNIKYIVNKPAFIPAIIIEHCSTSRQMVNIMCLQDSNSLLSKVIMKEYVTVISCLKISTNNNLQ